MKFYTVEKETGKLMEEFASIEDAKTEIERYEIDDKTFGRYKPNAYDVITV